MGCLDKDIASCAMLAIGILPVGKGAKAIKALGKIIEGGLNLNKKIKWARGVLSRAVGAVKRGPGCNSFAPGTLVLLADGTRKPIEEIEFGDEVLAADEDTGERTEGRAVTALITGEGDKTLVTITTTDASGDVQEIVATDEHPFWLPAETAWVDAVDLTAGDWLQTSAGTWAQVTAIDVRQRHAIVHNLTIMADHTYYVAADESAEAVLAHNKNYGPSEGCALPTQGKPDGSQKDLKPLTNSQATDLAKYLRYQKVPGRFSQDQPVFRDPKGKWFITQDNDRPQRWDLEDR